MSLRLLDLGRAELAALHGRRLIEAVVGAEGRTLLAELIPHRGSMVDTVDNLELAAVAGADLLVVNYLDRVLDDAGRLVLPALGPVADLRALARLVGRAVGVNLEPGDVPPARAATPDNARRQVESGAALLVLTANPGAGTTLADLARSTTAVREAVGPEPVLVAGKMHYAGVPEPLTPAALAALVSAGADAAMVPLPGTVPGVTREQVHAVVEAVHGAGGLAMGTIGTSQEGASPSTGAALALVAKEVGVDVHHLGDSGLSGGADPELMYAYSVAMRGRRHTWRRMAYGNRQHELPGQGREHG